MFPSYLNQRLGSMQSDLLLKDDIRWLSLRIMIVSKRGIYVVLLYLHKYIYVHIFQVFKHFGTFSTDVDYFVIRL